MTGNFQSREFISDQLRRFKLARPAQTVGHGRHRNPKSWLYRASSNYACISSLQFSPNSCSERLQVATVEVSKIVVPGYRHIDRILAPQSARASFYIGGWRKYPAANITAGPPVKNVGAACGFCPEAAPKFLETFERRLSHGRCPRPQVTALRALCRGSSQARPCMIVLSRATDSQMSS